MTVATPRQSTFVVEPQILPILASEPPRAQLPAVVGKRELDALAAARAANADFDAATKGVGRGRRLVLSRLLQHRWNGIAMLGYATTGVTVLAAGLVAAIVGGVSAIETLKDYAPWICLGGVVMLASIPLGAMALEEAEDIEGKIKARRTLGSAGLEPLRLAHAKAVTPLERAVLSELAGVYLRDLDERDVKGEAPRVLLQQIAGASAKEDEATREAARAFVHLFALTHDDFGKLRWCIEGREALELEYVLAAAPDTSRGDLRAMLRAALFDGEKPRLRLEPASESRLYRVLNGLDEPTPRPEPPPALPTGKQLGREARALERELFTEGKLVKHIGPQEAEKLLAVLRGAAEQRA